MKTANSPSVSGPCWSYKKLSNENTVLSKVISSLIAGSTTLLDIGSGDGSLIAALARGRQIIAIESSVENIPGLARSLSDFDYVIISAPFEGAEIPATQVDAITAIHSLYYIPNLRPAFRKILAILKPDGTALFVLLANQGDQSNLIKKYWRQYHNGQSFPHPTPRELTRICLEFGISAQSKRVISYCPIRTKAQKLNFLSLALDVPAKELSPLTCSGFDQLLGKARPFRRPHFASTFHEIIYFTKHAAR